MGFAKKKRATKVVSEPTLESLLNLSPDYKCTALSLKTKANNDTGKKVLPFSK